MKSKFRKNKGSPPFVTATPCHFPPWGKLVFFRALAVEFMTAPVAKAKFTNYLCFHVAPLMSLCYDETRTKRKGLKLCD